MTDMREVPHNTASARWARAKAVFGAALERAPDERRAFVDATCGTDDALRAEVVTLLAAHESAGSFLEERSAPADDSRRFTPSSDHHHGGEMLEHEIPLPPGLLAGRYTIQRELGRGGMATVYLATDLRHPRSVAVKVLHSAIAASVDRERFLREIRITARLVHPHILPMHESGESDGMLFYVMPYVAGETLREHLRRTGRLSLAEALRIGREVADALAYAHAHGVVHRDIKPENILLSDGHAVVADFGIGHVAGDRLTGTGFVVGTAAYMSPEQAAGDRALDGRADIYSLGCVLYEMLSGSPPPRDVRPPVSMRTLRGDVPPAVEQALSIALASDPAQRFATARQLADVLARSDATDPAAVPAVVPPRPSRHARTAGVVALITLALASFAWFLRPTRPAPLVTVAAFHVATADPELQRWSYDLPLLVASRLDAAYPLRASTPVVGIGRQPDVTDRSGAAALGRRTGAQYVVFGRVLRSPQHAVHVEAEVVDVAREEVVDEVQSTGTAAMVDGALSEVSDSLSRALLTSFGASLPVAAARHAAFGCASSSWPAVASYLRGEQFYRRTQWDSAVTAYQTAIALDSGCALAYHRIAVALSWRAGDSDSSVLSYRLKAGAHNHGLPPRDSLLVTADSLAAAVQYARAAADVPASAFWASVRRLLSTLEEASRQYPGDPEVWYALGDARYHHGWGPASTTVPEILGAFDNAIRQDSGFALSYLHPMELAYLDGGRDRAMRYVNAYLATNPTGVNADGVRLAAALADPRRDGTPGMDGHLVEASSDALEAALNRIERWPDSAESAIRISRLLAQRSGVDTLRIARCTGGFAPTAPAVDLARRLAYRGHFHAALCALGDSVGRRGTGVFFELAALRGIPDDMVARVYDDWLRRGHPFRNYALPWWAVHRDTGHLNAFVRRADSVLHAPSADTVQRERAHHDLAAGRAYLVLVQGDTGEVLAMFAALPRTECVGCFDFDRLTQADLLIARGDPDAADRIMREWRGATVTPSDIRIRFERARLAERRHDHAEALRDYRAVVDTWRDADPGLQPMVSAAHAALRRLGGV